MYRTIIAAALAATALTGFTASSAPADTEDCVSHPEFDNMEFGLSPTQVANRFDIFGTYLGDTDNGFKRGYRTCWAPGERRAIVEFSYETNESTDWYVRDVD